MKTDRFYLTHILFCLNRIEEYTRGGREEFFKDIRTQDAVARNLHIFAESSQRISVQNKERFSHVDWKSLSGFRNVIVHNYLRLDLEILWGIIQNHIPKL